MSSRKKLIVVGNGMVGHRFVERLIAERAGPTRLRRHGARRGAAARLRSRRTCRSSSTARAPTTCRWSSRAATRRPASTVRLGDRGRRDRPRRRGGRARRTGDDAPLRQAGARHRLVRRSCRRSRGATRPGCFVYRTIEDLEAIRAYAAQRRRSGAVIGGGLLGLRRRTRCTNLGLETHVVEFAPRLMPLQVDDAGGAVLRRRIEALGVAVHTGDADHARSWPTTTARVARAACSPTAASCATDLVVFSAGIRPRDELARAAGPRPSASAAASRSTTRCRTSRPGHLRHRRVRARTTAASTAWSRPATRWREVAARRSPAGDERASPAST